METELYIRPELDFTDNLRYLRELAKKAPDQALGEIGDL